MKGTVVHAILLGRKKTLGNFWYPSCYTPWLYFPNVSQFPSWKPLPCSRGHGLSPGIRISPLSATPPPFNLFQRLLTLPFITPHPPGVKTGISPQTPRPCLLLSSPWQTSFIHRAFTVSILGFADHMNVVATTQLCHCSTKASTDYLGGNGMHVFQ